MTPLDLSSLFSPPTGTPQQGMPQGLLSLFGGGGGTAGNPATQQMQQGMGMLGAGQPYQLRSPPMQRPMMGGGGMRQMGMPQQPGMMPGGAGMGTANGNPFLAALLQRLQQGQPQQPQQPTLPQQQGMAPSPLSFNLMGSGY